MPATILVIDSRVADYSTLLEGIAPGVEAILIDAGEDGVHRIASCLQGRSGIDSIQIVAHGSEGALYLGNTVLDSGSLVAYAEALDMIGRGLDASGDLLLYGCNIGRGELGQGFVDALAKLTGADVAASSDLTGAPALGGNWVLEVASGAVESSSVLAVETRVAYKGVLAANTAPSFGVGDGRIISATSGADFSADVLVQADGKILFAGGGERDFVLLRYNGDGSLDKDFAGTGKLSTDFGRFELAHGLALQPDGKVLVAGSTNVNDGSYDFALARYNADGSLDTSFSGDGMLYTDFAYGTDFGEAVALQADGKILVAGYGDYNFALVRYNVDGRLDTSFSADGKLTTDFGGLDFAHSVVVQPDGKILVGGSKNLSDFALARYNPDGSLDTSFSGDGTLTTSFGGIDLGASVALQDDGKILLAGYSGGGHGDGDFALARYNADGSLDTSFSGDGKQLTDLGGDDYGRSVEVQADGKILVVGIGGASNQFAVARYNTDGSPDTSFDDDGVLTTGFPGSHGDWGFGVAVQADDKIVVGGITYDGNTSAFALARFDPNGGLDATFDQDILNGTPHYIESGPAVVIDSDVRIFDAELSAAGNYAGATLTLARHGGANAADRFSATGNLGALVGGGDLLLGGVVIGRVTRNTEGILSLRFGANATQERVDAALQSIAYANGSEAPPPSAQIDWVFSDGNVGVQGSGGTLAARGSTTVAITPVNDGPQVAHPLTDQMATQGSAFAFTFAADAFCDVDAGDSLSYSASLANGGALPDWLAFGADIRSFSGNPDVANVGLINIKVTARDSFGESSVDTFRLVIDPLGGTTLAGDAADNHLDAGAGNDALFGLPGTDTLVGGAGDNLLNGGPGDDAMDGGLGNDSYVVESPGDIVIEASGLASEVDTVRSAVDWTLGANLERLMLVGAEAIDGSGNGLANRLNGNAAANSLSGGAGNDTLVGAGGDDVLIGGQGRDVMSGGLGADRFDFDVAAHSGLTSATRDVITDFKFSEGDRIDLSTIDADAAAPGNQAFAAPTVGGTFAGTFANPGELYFDQVAHLLYGNTDADGAAEFVIQLNGVSSLTPADLLL